MTTSNFSHFPKRPFAGGVDNIVMVVIYAFCPPKIECFIQVFIRGGGGGGNG